MSYYNETTGITMAGVSLIPSISGTTGIVTINGSPYTGYGEVYGIYWNKSANPTFGLAPHTTGIKTSPGTTGKIFYPRPDPLGTGSGIQLKFQVTIWSGVGIVLSGSDSRLSGINSGLSGNWLPSGYLLHKESYKLLPNYAFPTGGVYRVDIDNDNTPTAYDYSSAPLVGGFYPSMLNDNIISLSLEITWSGSSGDALNC